MSDFAFLLEGIQGITPQILVMWVIGGLLIFLAIKKDMEPALLLPMGFGAILVNIPFTGVLNTDMANGIIEWLFNVGIHAAEAMPLLLFVGVGAMIDFGPLLSNPKMLLFGGAAQLGIFITVILAVLLGLSPAGRDVHRYHWGGGWAHLDPGFPAASEHVYGGYRGGGVFLYGVGAHHTAVYHPAGYHQEGTHDSDAL